jgi:uncharacterized protein (DUF1778 family)
MSRRIEVQLSEDHARALEEEATREAMSLDDWVVRTLLQAASAVEHERFNGALASRKVLARYWDTPEEDEAWNDLLREP